MSSFADNVFEVFDVLSEKHRFIPAKAAAGKRFASLVRHETDDVFVYVFVHDGRASNANVVVDIWVAPPESPDDSLEKLYVGYKIQIGSEYEVDDAFFKSCQSRIIHFLACVPPMIPSIRQELDSPYYITRRWTVYRIERASLSSLLSKASLGDEAARSAVDTASRLATGNGAFRRLEEIVLPIAITLLEEGSLEASALDFFQGNGQSLASTLAAHLYIRALGEVSRTK